MKNKWVDDMTGEVVEVPIRNSTYVEHDKVYSDLVYPLDKGYYYVAELAQRWVKSTIRSRYGVSEIANKYAIKIDDILVTNHDGNYYLTAMPTNTVYSGRWVCKNGAVRD